MGRRVFLEPIPYCFSGGKGGGSKGRKDFEFGAHSWAMTHLFIDVLADSFVSISLIQPRIRGELE